MPRTVDVFQAMLLREYLLEPQLADALAKSGGLARLGQLVAGSPSIADTRQLRPFLGPRLPSGVTQQALEQVVPIDLVTTLVGELAAELPRCVSREERYAVCCRSALCHGVVGSYYAAFEVLRAAAAVDDGWARHHHIYGLIHGACGKRGDAQFELERARASEPYPVAVQRIDEALALLRDTSN